ncbi:MAG: hypothetical protein K2W82_17615 [Candidatus Obscuribacterales bacterium]|jgi:hypothetical protein|nr:hypothetical protein [Candidatus Obscuribacterales bacterium]
MAATRNHHRYRQTVRIQAGHVGRANQATKSVPMDDATERAYLAVLLPALSEQLQAQGIQHVCAAAGEFLTGPGDKHNLLVTLRGMPYCLHVTVREQSAGNRVGVDSRDIDRRGNHVEQKALRRAVNAITKR